MPQNPQENRAPGLSASAPAKSSAASTPASFGAPANNLSTPDPHAILVAEIEACRKAMDFCFALAMGEEEIEELYPRAPWNKIGDLGDRFRVMGMAIELMKASGAMAESIGKMKTGGEMRQSITVDKYQHGPASAGAGQNLSRQKPRERRVPANSIHAEGEGGGAENEK